MLVYKYYCRPVDSASENAALDEIARYVQARNRLLRLREKWRRITENNLLPEFRQIAAELRATPRTGRKPSSRTRIVASDPIGARAKPNVERIVSASNEETALAALRERYREVEVAERDLGRPDCEELSAADNRALYAEFIAAGGSYATWWLAEAAAKKAKHPVRDEYAGRAGILPERLQWDGHTVRYHDTTWSVHWDQLADRPIPEQARIAQAWLQRERITSGVVTRPSYKWLLVLVLDDVAPARHAPAACRTAAGIDIAWRQDDNVLRVAYVADDAGAHRAIRITAEQYAQFQHAASIARLADEDANWLRADLGVPDNTSHRRLLELAPPAPYDHTRPPGHRHEYATHLEHLLQWQHGTRRNAIASRDALYLQEVHALCAAHHTIYVERMKATPELVQKANTRKKKGAPVDAKGGVAREQRQMVAPFTFLRTLQREAGKFGTEVIEVPAEYTSRICVACDYDLGRTGQRERSCGGCGQRWDIDHLAALNLLRWGAARRTADSAAE